MSIALEVRDALTSEHCWRAQCLAVELGRACGVNSDELEELRIGAQFHDIGKIGIPDALLYKPGSLTQQERELINTHSTLGERIFMASAIERHESIARVIRHHHEAWDGSGYPDGLAGEAIPLLARILRVVDCYDAMTTVRAYHPSRAHAEVMDILEAECGTKADPEVFRAFTRAIDSSPVRGA